jgi:hypothetical protein
MIRMNICGGDRLCGVGMLWIGGVILGSFATAFMLLRPFMLEAYFDAFAQGLLRTSSLASSEHFAADRKQETSIAPFTIRQERQITSGFSDLCVWLVFMRLSRLPLMKVLHTQEVMNTHPAL